MHTIYTIGYGGSSPDDLQKYVETLDAVLVDVRYSPRSRVAHWSRKRLSERFDGRYVHLKELGNENYREGPVKLHAPEAAVPVVRALLDRHSGVILLCACREVRDCHRRDAAAYLIEALGSGEIVHLPPRFRDYEVHQPLLI